MLAVCHPVIKKAAPYSRGRRRWGGSGAIVHALEHRFAQLSGVGRDADKNLVSAFNQLRDRLVSEVFRADHHVIRRAFAASTAAKARIDHRRSQFDDSDTGRLQLMPQAERERVQGGLGRAVDRHVRQWRESQARRDVDDAGRVLLAKHRQQFVDQVDRCREVDGDLLIEAIDARICGEISSNLDAGIVDEHVERRMLCLQPLNHRASAARISDVADACRQGRELGPRLLQGGLAASADNDLVALVMKALGKREADTGGAASDKDRVVCKFHGRTFFRSIEEGASTSTRGKQQTHLRNRQAGLGVAVTPERGEMPFGGTATGLPSGQHSFDPRFLPDVSLDSKSGVS